MKVALKTMMAAAALAVFLPLLASAADPTGTPDGNSVGVSENGTAEESASSGEAKADMAGKTGEPHPGVYVGEPKSAGATPGESKTGETKSADDADADTYDQKTVLQEADKLFGTGAKDLADVIAKAFEDQGRPNGYIVGEEAGAAIGVGLRYGHGTLRLKKGGVRKVYWQAPSVGFDAGGNAAKTLVLVYNLPSIGKIYQRFPGIDGSVYVVGGVGVNYNQRGNIVLAPIRVGVGWRVGASVGYLKVTPTKTFNPF